MYIDKIFLVDPPPELTVNILWTSPKTPQIITLTLSTSQELLPWPSPLSPLPSRVNACSLIVCDEVWMTVGNSLGYNETKPANCNNPFELLHSIFVNKMHSTTNLCLLCAKFVVPLILILQTPCVFSTLYLKFLSEIIWLVLVRFSDSRHQPNLCLNPKGTGLHGILILRTFFMRFM